VVVGKRNVNWGEIRDYFTQKINYENKRNKKETNYGNRE